MYEFAEDSAVFLAFSYSFSFCKSLAFFPALMYTVEKGGKHIMLSLSNPYDKE